MTFNMAKSLKITVFGLILGGLYAQSLTSIYAAGEEKQKKNLVDEKIKSNQQQAEYHFSLAQGYANEGDVDKAIEEYKLALIFDSESALIHARLASELVKKGMLSAALGSAKEAVRLDPKFIDARLILAGLYSTAHENQAALDEYDQILKFDPKNEEALIYKCQVLLEDGKVSQAAVMLRQYTQKNPDSALGFYYLARAEQIAGHFKPAVSAYQRAIILRPSFSQSSLGLGYLYEEHQLTDQAVAVYKTIFSRSKDEAAANRLATILLKKEKYAEAIPYLKSIEASDPEDLNAQVKLGLVYMELKQHDEAIASLKKILQKTPDSDRIHYYLGMVYQQKKMVDLALEELKRIQVDSRLYPDSVLQACYLLKQSQRNSDARKLIQDAIQRAPKVANFYIFQASLEEEDKHFQAALKILEGAATQFPEDEKIHYYLGSLYDRLGDVDRGLEQMEAILKINPDSVDAMNYIGYTWTQRGIRLNDAEKLLKKALVLRPQNGYIQDSWGWYLLVRGRLSEAVVELEKAVKLKPNESTILEHLGDAYLRSNLRAKALDQYLVAEKYAENEATKKKIEAKLESVRKELGMNFGGQTTSVDSKGPADLESKKNK